jgi:hypothetical protein
MALNEHYAGGANGDAERDPRLDRLYREAGRESPPTRLDAAILAAARREAGARPRSVSSTLRRWHVPVSVAAVVIVSVTLVILVREEQAERIEEVPVPAAATSADQAAAPRTQPTPAEATRETAAQPGLAAPALQRQESRDDARFSAALGKREDSARTESGAPASSGVAAVATPAPAAKPLPKPPLAPPRVAEERAAPSPADAVTAGRIAGAPDAATEPLLARGAEDAPPAKAMARAMQSKPAKLDRQPAWHGFEKEPPQKWLERIEELKRQGLAAEAEDMLSEFKRRFPEHPLPPGLK